MNCVLLSAATFLVLGLLLWVAKVALREYRLDHYRNGFLAGTKATMKARVVKNPSGQDVYYVDGIWRDPYEGEDDE